MSRARRIIGGLRALFRNARVEQELDAELREFFDAAVDEKVRTGLDRADAVRAVRLEMGTVDLVKERVRDVGWETSVDTLVQDVRYAVRTLRRAPGFAAIAVGSSALGVGACSVIFAILNFAVLQAPACGRAATAAEPVGERPRYRGSGQRVVVSGLSRPATGAILRGHRGVRPPGAGVHRFTGRSATTLGSHRHRELFRCREAEVRRGPRLRCEPGRHTRRLARRRAEP